MLVSVRYLTSKIRGDEAWERPMPPLVPLRTEEKGALEAAVSRCV
jgi:hypothetical protein